MMNDLTTEMGCTVKVRTYPIGELGKIAMVLDMGPEDGRITPEVLFTPDEARALAARLTEAADR